MKNLNIFKKKCLDEKIKRKLKLKNFKKSFQIKESKIK